MTKLIPLDARPEGPLIGVRKMKKRINEELVGDYFASIERNEAYLRVYSHDKNEIRWFLISEKE